MMPPFRLVNLYLIVTAAFFGGCSKPSTKTLADVVQPPFKIQYPARSDIVPGAIWQAHGDVLASPMFDSPQAIKKTEADAGFTNIQKQTIVVADAEADLAPLAKGTIKDLKAELAAKHIRSLTVEGKYKILGVQGLGYVVRPETLAQCDDDYVLTLREIEKNPRDRTKFVTQVVTVKDFKYVAKVNNAFQVEADLKATGVVAGAGFNATNDQTLSWEMPSGQPMVVAWMTDVLPPLPHYSIVESENQKQAEVKKGIESEFDKRLEAIESRLQQLPEVPIGTIVAWHEHFPNTPPFPDDGRWMRCDGSRVNDPKSPYHNLHVPKLNGDRRFLRGGLESGLEESDDLRTLQVASFMPGESPAGNTPYTHGPVNVKGDGSVQLIDESARTRTAHRDDNVKKPRGLYGGANKGDANRLFFSFDNSGNSEVRPKNMSVVWIIRIK